MAASRSGRFRNVAKAVEKAELAERTQPLDQLGDDSELLTGA